jgi:hypothetical protein
VTPPASSTLAPTSATGPPRDSRVTSQMDHSQRLCKGRLCQKLGSDPIRDYSADMVRCGANSLILRSDDSHHRRACLPCCEGSAEFTSASPVAIAAGRYAVRLSNSYSHAVCD